MRRPIAFLSLAALCLTPSLSSAQGNLTVSYSEGRLTLMCSDVPLEQVFDQIKATTGMELILEDDIKNTRLTANIVAQPLRFAMERLLAGSGVNYALFFNQQDWQKVDKIFIGAGGGGPATPSRQATTRPPSRRQTRRPTPVEEDPYPEEDMVEEEFAVEEDADLTDADLTEEEPDLELAPEAVPDASSYVPPAPSFPRSSFTPGLESNPFGANAQGRSGTAAPAPNTGSGNNPPPAYYPFLDPLGRPIPVPPGANPQQQQQKKNQQD